MPPDRHPSRALPLAVVALATAVWAAACGSTTTTSVGPTPQRCQLTLNSTPDPVPAAGGAITVAVTADPECQWQATETVSWITQMTPASGQGEGRITLTAAANNTLTARQDNVSVNDVNRLIRQEAGTCSPQLSALSTTVTAEARSVPVTVTVISGCPWTATSNAGFVTVASGASGNANGTVSLNIAANPAAASRQGTVTIAGQNFTVTQGGANCTYTVSPASQVFDSNGGAGSATVSSPEGCAWSITSSASFVTITSGGSGSGTGAVTYAVAQNPTLSARSGILTIAGQTFTVNQEALVCSYSIAPGSQNVAASGGSGTVAVSATGAACNWTVANNNPGVVTVTAGGGGGSGNGTVSFSVGANPAPTARSATLTIAGQTFTVNQEALACEYSISPTSQNVAANGGSGSITVATQTGCTWTVADNDPGFVTVTGGGGGGSGNGTVSFGVSANPSPTARSGTLTVAGQTFTVNQAGLACEYSISPTSQSVAASGGSGSMTVSTQSGCTWTVANNDPGFVTVTGGGGGGSGNGTVSFSVGANPAPAARSGTLTVAGQTFTVNQAGAACDYSISPTSQNVAASGGSGSITVGTQAGCTWTVANNNPGFISVTGGGGGGNGNGTVSFNVSVNTSGNGRSGTLTIAGQTFTVNQEGVACTFSLSPTSANVGAGASTGSTSVTAPAGCGWTATSNNPGFLTITGGGSGVGTGTTSFSVAANNGAPRSGTLTIGGQTFTVNQASGCSFIVAPLTLSPTSAGGTSSVTVTAAAGCAWTAVSNNTGFITVTGGASGNGNGTATVNVAANTGAARSGTLTIASQTVNVTQAAGCSYSIAPTSLSVPAAGGPGSSTVTTAAGCAWTAASNNTAFITVTNGANGNGPGATTFTIAANTGAARTGTLTIAGQTLTVNQAAGACTFSISPTSRTHGNLTNLTGSVAVTATAGCAWTASSNNTSMITVAGGANGAGNGTVNYVVTPQLSGTRTGTLTIAGLTFTVTQGP